MNAVKAPAAPAYAKISWFLIEEPYTRRDKDEPIKAPAQTCTHHDMK